jgi:hypothetical protein
MGARGWRGLRGIRGKGVERVGEGGGGCRVGMGMLMWLNARNAGTPQPGMVQAGAVSLAGVFKVQPEMCNVAPKRPPQSAEPAPLPVVMRPGCAAGRPGTSHCAPLAPAGSHLHVQVLESQLVLRLHRQLGYLREEGRQGRRGG